ncbi:hypothetical protein D3C72_272410 [compost metagenome]
MHPHQVKSLEFRGCAGAGRATGEGDARRSLYSTLNSSELDANGTVHESSVNKTPVRRCQVITRSEHAVSHICWYFSIPDIVRSFLDTTTLSKIFDLSIIPSSVITYTPLLASKIDKIIL